MSILNSFVNGMQPWFSMYFIILIIIRYLRARCHWGLQACCLQQEVHHLVSWDPDLVCQIRLLHNFQDSNIFAVSAWSSLVNLRSTLSLRAPRPSPSTLRLLNRQLTGVLAWFLFATTRCRVEHTEGRRCYGVISCVYGRDGFGLKPLWFPRLLGIQMVYIMESKKYRFLQHLQYHSIRWHLIMFWIKIFFNSPNNAIFLSKWHTCIFIRTLWISLRLCDHLHN